MENAAAFLRTRFPKRLSAAVRWDELRLKPGTFIDSHYRESESDLLFSAPLGQTQCFLYILFEHQRKKDPFLALRLLRYMVRIWEDYLSAHPEAKKLPLIVPVVLAHNEKGWDLSPDFASLVELPEEIGTDGACYVPDFRFDLIELANLPVDRIVGTPAGILVLRTLRAERFRELLGDAVWDEELMTAASLEIFEMVLRYILAQGDVDKRAFENRVKQLQNSKIKDNAMTLAQQYRQEGWQEAMTLVQQYRQEGRLLTQQAAVIEALEIRFERVPEGLREEIERIEDSGRLRDLHRAAIRCADLENFAAEL